MGYGLLLCGEENLSIFFNSNCTIIVSPGPWLEETPSHGETGLETPGLAGRNLGTVPSPAYVSNKHFCCAAVLIKAWDFLKSVPWVKGAHGLLQQFLIFNWQLRRTWRAEMGAQEAEILDDDESSCLCHHCQAGWAERCSYKQIVGVWPTSSWLPGAFLLQESICVASGWWIPMEAFLIWARVKRVPG